MGKAPGFYGPGRESLPWRHDPRASHRRPGPCDRQRKHRPHHTVPAGARRLPARLPRHLRPAHHGGERRGRACARQPRTRADGRRAVRQGLQIPRAHLPCGAHPHAPQTQRPQGQRAVHARGLERGAAGYCCAPGRDRRARPAGHPALQLCRHHGPGAGREHGPALLPPPGRIAPGPHHLRHRRRRGPGAHAGRQGGHAGGVLRRIQAHPHLGQQLDWQQPAFLAHRPAGQARRRQAGVHRPAQERNRREMPGAHPAPARHRRGAGTGADARAHRARLARPRLHRPPHRGLGAAARTRPAMAARARRAGVRRAGGADPPARARLRHHPARRHPPELRHAARARRRQRSACHCLPARTHGRLAPPGGRRAAVQLGQLPGGPRRAAAPRPAGGPQPAHHQHGDDWR